VEGGFEGLKVLDAASFIAAPAAATILADFGADVIKIEPPGEGDAYRNVSFQPGMPVGDTNYCWTVDDRNKRSLALDLKHPEAQNILHGLIAGADVFITNYPLPARRRLGIAYDQLAHINPRLIYASLTAYGEKGAEAEKPGFDSTAWWARSGMMEVVRPDAESLPARSIPGMGDHPTALALYGAIVTALFRRERTGVGAYVGSSLLASGMVIVVLPSLVSTFSATQRTPIRFSPTPRKPPTPTITPSIWLSRVPTMTSSMPPTTVPDLSSTGWPISRALTRYWLGPSPR